MMSVILTLLATASVSGSHPQYMSEVTQRWQMEFSHITGFDGRYLFPEITGSGLAVIDVDNDGLLDIYLVQAGSLDANQSHTDRLLLNEGSKLQDVTSRFGLSENGYGMGAAVADVDGDGFDDLLVTNFGANQLLMNQKGTRFMRNAEFDGGEPNEWSTSASFFDFDRDGDLDLYIANYVDFDLKNNPSCYSPSSRKDYCGPSNFTGQPDRFYENENGRLVDRTARYFPEMSGAAGLGVVARDFNGDGWVDLYVANDGEANFLWLNENGESFKDDALFAGVAMNSAGLPEASMGIVADDLDGDGDMDLFLSHLKEETNTLYRNDGNGEFSDRTAQAGLASPSSGYTGWGTLAVDVNADNLLDLIVVNGAVRTLEDQRERGNRYPFVEVNQLYLQQADGFDLVAPAPRSAFYAPYSSRGALKADLNNDGAPEVLISNSNAPAQIFSIETPKHWLGVKLTPEAVAVGAQVKFTVDDKAVWRTYARDGSYASSSDPRILITVPESQDVVDFEVHWPDGSVSRHQVEEMRRYHTISREKN